MTFLLHPALRCPIEAAPLKIDGLSLVCSHGHRFDIARQGYVNFLGPNDKRSRDPGDSKKMVAARAAFLGANFYRPLADACLDITREYCSQIARDAFTLMDAGCGDGYFIHHVQENLSNNLSKRMSLVGFDVSKWAMQKSARRCKATWFVGSNRNIPMIDKSVDLLFDMFGFPDYASFSKILAPQGRLVRVTPGHSHLIQLRQIIYANIKDKSERKPYPETLRVVSEKRITYEVALRSRDIHNLLLMTPHMFRSTSEHRQRALNQDQLTVTIDVMLEELIPTTAT